jgi:hypothetical protein
MNAKLLLIAALATSTAMLAGCSSATDDSGDNGDGSLDGTGQEVSEVASGPAVASTDGEVWAIQNQWADKDTANAQKAGVAWEANSGLTWEEKFGKWLGTFTKIPGQNGFDDTIQITTPWGTTVPGPALECADVAIWLRITFSSWYHLPFYLTGYDANNKRTMYAGSFGIVGSDGQPLSGYPHFKAQYKDYEPTYNQGDDWPTDAALDKKHVGDNDDDTFLPKLPDGSNAGAGAYYDGIFLNKRVGYFIVLMDALFGSANLADGANMFQIKPEATREGDALLERWQKDGIGHTLPVIHVDHPDDTRMQITVSTGSMPRRQPKWQGPDQSPSYFESDNCGGKGTTSDGTPLAKLGGGIRRWRTAVASGGKWTNIVPLLDRDIYINDANLDAISARPARFAELLKAATPDQARDAALAIINSARETLHEKPASCSARTQREEGFKQLYDVMTTSFNSTKQQVDADNRTLEDYVYAELDYTTSKTCCWDTTTSAMNDIIQQFASDEKAANDKAGVCKQPTVFKNTAGGYQVFKDYAAKIGKAADWKEWNEDEPCSQRAVADDTLTDAGKTDMCSSMPPPPATDPTAAPATDPGTP